MIYHKLVIQERPPQDIDVPVVLDVQIPCFRLEIPALYLISLLTNHEGHGRKLGRPRRLKGREEELQTLKFKDQGRRGCRPPKEPCFRG